MLLLHQEVELIEAPEGSAVLLVIVGERLAETDVGKATFVLNSVAHIEKAQRYGGAGSREELTLSNKLKRDA
jgi:hypothetical protein